MYECEVFNYEHFVGERWEERESGRATCGAPGRERPPTLLPEAATGAGSPSRTGFNVREAHRPAGLAPSRDPPSSPAPRPAPAARKGEPPQPAGPAPRREAELRKPRRPRPDRPRPTAAAADVRSARPTTTCRRPRETQELRTSEKPGR